MMEPDLATSTAAGWHALMSGQTSGPYTWNELYGLAQQGRLLADDYVWHPSLPGWVPATQIPNLIQGASPRRRRWLLPSVIAAIIFVLGGLGVGLYFALSGKDGTGDSIAMGRAEVLDADPARVVMSERLGAGPADQVLVLMAEGKGRAEAEAVAAELGGSVVGEVEYIGLYQIQTSGTTAHDLESAVERAGADPDVEAAFPNGVVANKVTIEGTQCSPLSDPLYGTGDNARPYEMIGIQDAWDIIRASGVELGAAHVGVVDSTVYTNSGHDFGPELHFPDEKGNYPDGKPRVRGLEPKDVTDQPADGHGGLSHGTQVAHVIGADPSSGAAGVAGVIGDKLTMTFGTFQTGSFRYAAENPDEDDPTQYQGFFVRELVEVQKQIKAGATVINLSLGPREPSVHNSWRTQAYRRFFEKMAKDRPGVVFVAAAGNENGALDGTNYGPGGISLPNVITVGALDSTGDRATAADWHDPADIQAAYDAQINNGTISAETTIEDFTADIMSGSNYVTGGGEVTISASGTDVPTGLDPEGRPVTSSGTSFATPQVTAAVALLQSIDPELSAADVKRILAESAASEVEQADGTKVAVPPDVGGRVLRVDAAVLQAINELRAGPPDDPDYPKLPPLDRDELLGLANLRLTAEGGPEDFTITASVDRAGPDGADVKIEVNGRHSLTGTTTQSVSAGSDATWKMTLQDDSVFVRVVRSDTGGCAFMTIDRAEDVSGLYEATGTVTMWGSTDPIKDFQAKVERSGTGMTISFSNDSATVLTGTYDEATKTFRGTDVRPSDDPATSVWWQWGETTIVFDTKTDPVSAVGRLWVPKTEGEAIVSWDITVDFVMQLVP